MLQITWRVPCVAGSLDVMEIFNGREVFKMKVQVGYSMTAKTLQDLGDLALLQFNLMVARVLTSRIHCGEVAAALCRRRSRKS